MILTTFLMMKAKRYKRILFTRSIVYHKIHKILLFIKILNVIKRPYLSFFKYLNGLFITNVLFIFNFFWCKKIITTAMMVIVKIKMIMMNRTF